MPFLLEKKKFESLFLKILFNRLLRDIIEEKRLQWKIELK